MNEKLVFRRILSPLSGNLIFRMSYIEIMLFSETEELKISSFDGKSLDMHLWEVDSPKAVFIAVHGGLTHAGDWEVFAVPMMEKGYTTVGHDLRGHKQKVSHIKRFDHLLQDLSTVVSWAKARYPDTPMFLVGHSIGGLIVTHWGIKYHDPVIKGYIMSSPYYANVIHFNPILLKVNSLLSVILPKMPVKVDDVTNVLTRDEEITKMHVKNRERGLRTSTVSSRFAEEISKAQAWVPKHFSEWSHPALFFIAGNDHLADANVTMELVKELPEGLVDLHHFPDNMHENFNELNRNEIFDLVDKWVSARI